MHECRYDGNGNVIYQKHANGNEFWRKYDEENRVVYYKDGSLNIETVIKYTETGKISTTTFSDGTCSISEYDSLGNILHYKSHDGYEYTKDYDEAGREIHGKYSDGFEYWKEYKNGKCIHYKTNDGVDEWYTYGHRVVYKPINKSRLKYTKKRR